MERARKLPKCSIKPVGHYYARLLTRHWYGSHECLFYNARGHYPFNISAGLIIVYNMTGQIIYLIHFILTLCVFVFFGG